MHRFRRFLRDYTSMYHPASFQMDFITIAKTRCSIRSYTQKKVERSKLEKILEAAHVAPTAANLEPVSILAVGYAGENFADPERHSQTRIPVGELVSYESLSCGSRPPLGSAAFSMKQIQPFANAGGGLNLFMSLCTYKPLSWFT